MQVIQTSLDYFPEDLVAEVKFRMVQDYGENIERREAGAYVYKEYENTIFLINERDLSENNNYYFSNVDERTQKAVVIHEVAHVIHNNMLYDYTSGNFEVDLSSEKSKYFSRFVTLALGTGVHPLAEVTCLSSLPH